MTIITLLEIAHMNICSQLYHLFCLVWFDTVVNTVEFVLYLQICVPSVGLNDITLQVLQ